MSPEDAKSKNPYFLWKSQYDNLQYSKNYSSSKKQYSSPKLMRSLKDKSPQKYV